jgi:organic radical activating enzyme
MTEKIHLDKLEFYITNVCNLTCSNCNRYNNFHFKGWAKWDDYAEGLEKLSRHVHVQKPVILGGEPLLNPDIVKWIRGLQRLWPNSYSAQIQSNGTRIDRVPGLYEALAEVSGSWIGVSIHRPEDREEIFVRIRKFLQGTITYSEDPNNSMGSVYQFRDSNGVEVHVWNNDMFGNTNVVEREDGRFGLYNSDPDRAHEICSFRKWKNYHWIRGRLYKCGPVALMPEFDQQHQFDISDEDRKILNGYAGLGMDELESRAAEFFRTIDDVIPQCKFCPETIEYRPVYFTNTKKSWRVESVGD